MDLLATHAARQPDHPAIVDGDTVLSWHSCFEPLTVTMPPSCHPHLPQGQGSQLGTSKKWCN